jgi:hypothetical protein
MSIDIEIYYATNGAGRAAVEAQSRILFSPREGFDADKIAALENDLGPYITARLNDALKKGGAEC